MFANWIALHINNAIFRTHLHASDERYLLWLRKSFMPRTRGILPQARAFAFVDVKSHDSVAKGTLLHLMVASHATARLIARRCSLDTRSQWPASPIAATVTRDVGRTRHNTQAPRHRLRCTVCAAPTPFALPLLASYPGARVIARTPGETRENSTRTNSRRIRIAHRNFRSRDRTTVEVRRLVCEGNLALG